MGELVFVSWYTQEAVYLDGRLIYYGEKSASWGILRALDYECRRLPEIPCHNIPPEYDRQPNKWWQAPKALEDLERRMAAVAKRERRQRIELLRKELAEAEKATPASVK